MDDGKGRERRACVAYTICFITPESHDETTIHVFRVRSYDSSCVTPNSQDFSTTREDSYTGRMIARNLHQHSRDDSRAPTTLPRRRVVDRRLFRGARSIGCRARDRSIADKPVRT